MTSALFWEGGEILRGVGIVVSYISGQPIISQLRGLRSAKLLDLCCLKYQKKADLYQVPPFSATGVYFTGIESSSVSSEVGNRFDNQNVAVLITRRWTQRFKQDCTPYSSLLFIIRMNKTQIGKNMSVRLFKLKNCFMKSNAILNWYFHF
jgi:hypothetical protein